MAEIGTGVLGLVLGGILPLLYLAMLLAASPLAAEPAMGSDTTPDFGLRRGSPSSQQVAREVLMRERERELWPEEVALDRIDETIMQWLGALHGRSIPVDFAAALFTPDARGSAPGGTMEAASDQRSANERVRQIKYAIEPKSTLAELALAWQRHMQGFDQVIRTEHHVAELHLDAAGPLRRAEVAVEVRITGSRGELLRQDQGRMLLSLLETDGEWVIESLSLPSFAGVLARSAFMAKALPLAGGSQGSDAGWFVAYFAEGASLMDLNADHADDLVLANRYGPAAVLLNDGRGEFREAGAELGLGELYRLRSAYGFDWDNDGDTDLLVVSQSGLALFEQADGGFSNVSARSGFDRVRVDGLTSAAVADFDGDGLLDFYVCGYGNPAQSPVFDYFDSSAGYFNKLFRNQGGGRFEDVTAAAGLDADNRRWTFSALWVDIDRNGRPDLYVVNDYGRNQLFRNLGDGRFEDIGAASGADDLGNGMAGAYGDVDGDGGLDLFVSNMHSWAGKRMLGNAEMPAERRDAVHHFLRGNSLLLTRDDGSFERRPGITDDAKWAWGNRLLDYDNDGDLDLYVANGMFTNTRRADLDPHFWRNMLIPVALGDQAYGLGSTVFAARLQTHAHSFAGHERNRFFHNAGQGRFIDSAAVLGLDLVQDGRAVVSGDLDADGDLDLVLANRNAPRALLLENVAEPRGHWLAVDLQGKASNRQGIGTWLSLRCANGREQVRYSQLGSGYVSQSSATQWFGLGDCARVESLLLRWPSGTEQELTDLAADQRIRVVEPGTGG